jgi:hypothetical protein
MVLNGLGTNRDGLGFLMKTGYFKSTAGSDTEFTDI